nr:hemin uptake protein HemP [Ectothiorhodospira lacustris]
MLSSRDLLEGRRQLQIEHQGAVYTLRVTSKGKLILTK